MSDLISRSEALQRLIQETVDSKNNLIHINTIKRLLQDVESAYSVDKVVVELEREKSVHTENYNISLYKDYPEIKQRYKQVCGVIDKAIEIVKQGGVSDDVCEWHCDEYGRWHTKCHTLADNDPLEYTYCPYCGKRIKAVE